MGILRAKEVIIYDPAVPGSGVLKLHVIDGDVPIIDFTASSEIGGGESFISGFGTGFQIYGSEETRICVMQGRIDICETHEGFLRFVE